MLVFITFAGYKFSDKIMELSKNYIPAAVEEKWYQALAFKKLF